MNKFQKHILCNVHCAPNRFCKVSGEYGYTAVSFLRAVSAVQSVSPVTFIKNRETTPQHITQEKLIISNESPLLSRKLHQVTTVNSWKFCKQQSNDRIRMAKRFWSSAFPLWFCPTLRNSTSVCYVQGSLLMPKYPVDSSALKSKLTECSQGCDKRLQGQSLLPPPGQRGFK